MEMKVSIFGIETDNQAKLSDHFDEVRDADEEQVFISKKTFKHEDENTFEYKYAIEVFTPEEGHTCYNLMVVPTFDSLYDSLKTSVCEFVGNSEPNILDVLDYGHYLNMGGECREDDVDESVLDAIASVYEMIDALRGFYFDKRVNMLGCNGWDYINEWCTGKDAIASFKERIGWE